VRRPERFDVLDLLRRVRTSPLGDQLILAGSSGLYGVSENIPALTEDIDVLIDADWVAGLEPYPGTSTFLMPDGLSLDLVGYSRLDSIDRIGGGKTVQVMVFGDLSLVLTAAGTTFELPTQGRALTHAALTVIKLMTIRLEKGSKDKLQALLLLDENAETPGFLEDLRRLLALFERDRVEDALGDAQVACLAISTDVMRAGAEGGYAEMGQAVHRGLALLKRLVHPESA
jgi:hypothetical protein